MSEQTNHIKRKAKRLNFYQNLHFCIEAFKMNNLNCLEILTWSPK